MQCLIMLTTTTISLTAYYNACVSEKLLNDLLLCHHTIIYYDTVAHLSVGLVSVHVFAYQ